MGNYLEVTLRSEVKYFKCLFRFMAPLHHVQESAGKPVSIHCIAAFGVIRLRYLQGSRSPTNTKLVSTGSTQQGQLQWLRVLSISVPRPANGAFSVFL